MRAKHLHHQALPPWILFHVKRTLSCTFCFLFIHESNVMRFCRSSSRHHSVIPKARLDDHFHNIWPQCNGGDKTKHHWKHLLFCPACKAVIIRQQSGACPWHGPSLCSHTKQKKNGVAVKPVTFDPHNDTVSLLLWWMGHSTSLHQLTSIIEASVCVINFAPNIVKTVWQLKPAHNPSV